jgi:hypothetical protein
MFQITLLLAKAFGFIKNIIAFLFKNPKILIAIIAVAAAAYLVHYISDVKKLAADAETARVTEQHEKEKAIGIAKTNQEAIDHLMHDQNLTDTSSKNLKNNIIKDASPLSKQRTKIVDAPKTSDGPLSPVLVETMNIIQESRKGR